ncbi:MAG: DnaB-like helicase C-terminal domain-containing protein, partial [Treponema sp.]|nr:DnaB-like helicase C-terminal domain-containing protein [Treponema sp.]
KIWTPKALAEDYNEFLKYSEETWGIERGITVGFPTLDRMTDGFQNEDVIIIGARPSIGKTALAISMMQNLMEKDVPCGFISAEMSQRQIMTRMVGQRTRLDSSTIRSGKYTNEMKQKLFAATAYYASRKFYIDDTPNIELDALISSARHMKLHYGIRILFVDYMGLITVNKDGPVWEKVSYISKSLKALARELKIPVVTLCQLGRDAEGNDPTISNIRGSGSVEQDADLVILLNGERDLTCYRNPNPFLERDMTLAKHRNGPCGKVYLNFEKQFTIFTEDPDQEGRAEEEKMNNMTDKERENYLAQKNKDVIKSLQKKEAC